MRLTRAERIMEGTGNGMKDGVIIRMKRQYELASHEDGAAVVSIARPLYMRIVSYLQAKLPEEACGALIGEAEPDAVRLSGFVPLANAAAASKGNRFAVDPREWVRLLYAEGAGIVGFVHSHPTAAPVPSALDTDRLLWTFPTYWIVSFAGNAADPQACAYKIKSRRPYRKQDIVFADEINDGSNAHTSRQASIYRGL